MRTLGLHDGSPAVFDPITGACVLVFVNTAKGWSKAVSLAIEVRAGAGK